MMKEILVAVYKVGTEIDMSREPVDDDGKARGIRFT